MAGLTKDKQTDKQKATQFQGERSNRNTKGNSSTRIQKSKLRDLADKLIERQDIALQLIDKSLKSEPVDPEAVASAKWVISSINSVVKSASAEELGSFNARLKGKRDEDQEAEQTPAEISKELKPRLSLVFVEPEDEE
jgi:hypothetical protein